MAPSFFMSRQQNPPMPANPAELTLVCLSALLRDDNELSAAAFEELIRRNDALKSPKEIHETLVRQITLLEAAATKWMMKANNAKLPDASRTFAYASSNASKTLLQALALTMKFQEEQRRIEALPIHPAAQITQDGEGTPAPNEGDTHAYSNRQAEAAP